MEKADSNSKDSRIDNSEWLKFIEFINEDLSKETSELFKHARLLVRMV